MQTYRFLCIGLEGQKREVNVTIFKKIFHKIFHKKQEGETLKYGINYMSDKHTKFGLIIFLPIFITPKIIRNDWFFGDCKVFANYVRVLKICYRRRRSFYEGKKNVFHIKIGLTNPFNVEVIHRNR